MSTLPDVVENAQEAVSGARDLEKSAQAHLPALSDERVVQFIEYADEQVQLFGDYRRAALSELEHRIRERRKTAPEARAIPHRTYEITLAEEFTPYRADVPKLREAQPLLPEDEAQKLLVAVPGSVVITLPAQSADGIARAQQFAHARNGHVEVIVPRDEPGNVSSILALAKKYAGTGVGMLLKAAITRDRTGEKLIFKPRKGASS